MNVEITGCKSCPLADWNYEVCKHPNREGRIDIYHELKEIPSACPLKSESLTLSIKQQ